MKRGFVTCGLLACLGMLGDSGRGDDQEQEDAARAARMAEMTRRVQGFNASIIRDGKEFKLDPCPEPLLRWTDPARKDTQILDAAIWAWGTKGRPAVLLTQESYGGNWAYELISASTDRIAVITGSGWRWSPEEPGVQFSQFQDAPTPAENSRIRLTQMRDLVRQFQVTQIGHDNTNYPLRLLSQPIHRYDDSGAGLVDGAFFAFVYGTNPEAIVVIECQRRQTRDDWFYGFLPVTVARIEATREGKSVWSRKSETEPQSQKPYTAFGAK
jgi:hypothetical protein